MPYAAPRNLNQPNGVIKAKAAVVVLFMCMCVSVDNYSALHIDWNLSFLTFWSITPPYYMLCM